MQSPGKVALEDPTHWPRLETYVKAVVADTAYLAPVGYVHDETGYLVDAASEITGALNSAVDKMLDDADEANPGAWLKARQAEVAR